ncbi:ABC transporter ATP-binding protein [Neiella sp. HB171785]|uniref:ABC transporter ATP-binding protein n=1 Tax=Neiella litorisoli TaxID=2771431 RepID=A0A8J6UF91_9GAMM|nr:ABC transporter ATP-binding protein [Neiella litorisoli]MBD1388591.1 ABC transporter ATP-binding protein [Neiella litorisoli]
MSRHTATPVFEVDNLSWGEGGQAILANINANIASHRFTGIIGPNGAGKTTFLRCLSGFYSPVSGGVSFLNKPLANWPFNERAQRLAVVTQHTDVDRSWSVEQLLATGLIPYKRWFQVNNQQDQDLLTAVLNQVGLADKRQRHLATLSGGELQRALIAKALVQQPECLLLDEPTNHLDSQYQLTLMKWIKRLGISVVASVHDINMAARFCDDLLLFKQGKLLAHGPVSEVFTVANLEHLFDHPVRVDRHPYHDCLWMNFLEQERHHDQ